MKNLLAGLLTFAMALGVMADVPSLINYQGKLKSKFGSNIEGLQNFDIKVFDKETGGNLLYEENIGKILLKEGVYSFGFGANGVSNIPVREVMAVADGEKQVFNFMTNFKPIDGDVKVSGGGYSWTQNGSSDISKFTATLNKTTGSVSAIFITGAPPAGTEVSVEYYKIGITDAVMSGGQTWLELTVEGVTLSPRERLVAVPYALRAAVAERVSGMPLGVLAYLNDILLKATFPNQWKQPQQLQYSWKANVNIDKKYPQYQDGIDFYVTDTMKTLEVKLRGGGAKFWSRTMQPQSKPLDIDAVRIISMYDDTTKIVQMNKLSETHFFVNAPEEGFYRLELYINGHFDRDHFMESKASIVVLGK